MVSIAIAQACVNVCVIASLMAVVAGVYRTDSAHTSPI